MAGDIASDMYLRTVVGMGSRSQDELDDGDIKLVISSNVAGVKEERIEGGESGGRCIGVAEGFDCKLK